MHLKTLISLLLCSFIASGCIHRPDHSTALAGKEPLAELSPEQVFAIHPNGDTLVYVNAGLQLLRLSDGHRQRLLFDAPDALLWSADGQKLVAAVREGERTRLVQLTAAAESRLQVFVDEQVTDLDWLADGSLLAMAQKVSEDEKRVQVQAVLLRWDGGRDVERDPLYRYSYAKPVGDEKIFAPQVEHRFEISPLKDELLYNRYLDAPGQEAGRVELVLYNLQTGREQVLTVTGDRQREGFFAADAEQVLLPQPAEVVLLNPWTGEVASRWSGSGQSLQVAADRNLMLVDGQLLSGENLLLRLPVTAKGRFSGDGSRLFVASERKLYLVEGYPLPEAIEYSDLEKLKLQRIRLQRSREEISLHDYYQARNNILHP